MSPIPSRLYNAAVGGHVAGADQIIDDETGLTLDKVAGGALEEKEYTSGSNNGMGRVVLRKNLVDGVNTLTQAMINKSNTIYVIQYNFVLGENITIPTNCVLDFYGGSITASGSSDTITGQNTLIMFTNPFISNTTVINGCYVLEETIKDSEVFKTIIGTQNEIETIISLAKEGSKLMFTAQSYQNIHDIVINKSLSLDFNNATIYAVIRSTNDNQQVFRSLESVENIELHNVSIDGQLPTEAGTIDTSATGLYNAAILIKNANSVVFDNVEIKNFDYGGSGTLNPNFKDRDNAGVCHVSNYKSIVADYCKLSKCHGEGFYFVPKISDNYCSITNCTIENFTNTPFTVIDGKIYCANNFITNVKFSALNLLCYDSIISDNIFTNAGIDDTCIDLTEQGSYYSRNVVVSNNTINSCGRGIALVGDNVKITNNTINCTVSAIWIVGINESYSYNDNNAAGKETIFEVQYNTITTNSNAVRFDTNSYANAAIEDNVFEQVTGASNPLPVMEGYKIKLLCVKNNTITGEGKDATVGTSNVCSCMFSSEVLDKVIFENNTFSVTSACKNALYVICNNAEVFTKVYFNNNKSNITSGTKPGILVVSDKGIEDLIIDNNENFTIIGSTLHSFINTGNLYKEIKSNFDSYISFYDSTALRENSVLNFVGGSLLLHGDNLTGNKTLLLGDYSKNGVTYNGTFKNFGTTRPTNVPIGFCFFDTSSSVNKPIYWNGTSWVDATGATV